MMKCQPIGALLAALVVPGASAYLLVNRVVHPPVTYRVMPPERAQSSPTYAVIHRGRAETGSANQDASSPTDSPSPERLPPKSSGQSRGSRLSVGDPLTNNDARGKRRPPAAEAPPSQSAARPQPRASGASPTRRAPGSEGPDTSIQSTMGLVRLFRGIGRLEEDGTTPLTPPQAKAILALMTPLLSQPTLTPSQAATIRTKLDAILTAAQREAIAQTPERFGRRDGPPGDGQPAMPSDDRREVSGHQRPGLPPENMENVNPFNPDSDHPMAARMAQRWQAVFDALDAKARQ